MWLKRSLKLGLELNSMILLISLSLLTTLSEIFGVSVFLPIFQFIRYDGNIELLIENSNLWKHLVNIFDFLNINISLAYLLFLAFSFFLIRQVFTYLRLIVKVHIGENLTKKIRTLMFNKYLKADSNFHDKLPIGNLVNSITTEVTSAVLGVLAPLELIVYIIMALGYLLIMFFLSIKMTLISILILLIVSQIPRSWIKKTSKVSRKLTLSNTLMSSFLVERLKSPRLVRLSNTEEAEINAFESLTNNQKLNSIKGARLQAKTEVIMEPFIIAVSLLFIYISFTYLNFSIEIIGLYIVIATRLMPVTKSIVTQWQTIKSFIGALELVESRLLQMNLFMEKDTGFDQFNHINKSIIFQDIFFGYEETSKLVLKNINLEIESGKLTTIVGPSGGGKSTLIDLIPRIRIQNSGKIMFDGKDSDQFSLKSLRSSISYTPQSPQIFDGTIMDHIKYGKLKSTKEEIVEASKMSGAYNFIMKLPNKFQTIIGEDGSKLSGGQKQRLDLARALLKDAGILILDEPTSNLDIETEKYFFKTLQEINVLKKNTIILITHRLNSIKTADKIIVINNGVIESQGTHEQLLKMNTWYNEVNNSGNNDNKK